METAAVAHLAAAAILAGILTVDAEAAALATACAQAAVLALAVALIWALASPVVPPALAQYSNGPPLRLQTLAAEDGRSPPEPLLPPGFHSHHCHL